ncbi:MAG TPA: TMEM175 family protein [Solirubrobacterales bacterium]|nr:TMEM175 family protein [Solirubrobacterales bacterium]
MARERSVTEREGNEVEFSRIVAFSDGVFAIAITLLVLNLTIDKGLSGSKLTEELLNNWDNLVAYAISFAVIGRFWVVHHGFFGEVRAFDGRLLGLNLFYLAWIVLIPFSSQVLGDYGGMTPSVVVYSVNLAAVVLVGLWLSVDARRRGLTTIDDETHREGRVRSTYIAGIFLLSIPLGFVAPRAAPYLWLLLFLDPSARLATRVASRGEP